MTAGSRPAEMPDQSVPRPETLGRPPLTLPRAPTFTRASRKPAQEYTWPREDRIMARSSGNAFFSNWSTYDAPFPTKVRLALANSWRKVRTGSSCCGNLGQPGC
jgi:hypothetical protein